MSCEWKNIILMKREVPEGTHCEGWSVHFISSASSGYIMHDTCVDRATYLTAMPTNHTTCGCSYCMPCCRNVSISEWNITTERLEGEIHKSPYDPQCTLWWTLDKSHLCSAGGDSLSVKWKTKQISHRTGNLWWWNSPHLETTECRKKQRIVTWR